MTDNPTTSSAESATEYSILSKPSDQNEAENLAPSVDEGCALPERVDLNVLQGLTTSELYESAAQYHIRVPSGKGKRDLVYEICSWMLRRRVPVVVHGILDVIDNMGVIRYPALSFLPGMDDIFVPTGFIKRHELRPGQSLTGFVRLARERDKLMSLDQLTEIDGFSADNYHQTVPFDRLTAMFPDTRIHLEIPGEKNVSCRVVELIAPIGKGQRALIVAPPRSGKTILLKELAKAITANQPDMEIMVVLVDERPEEVTDFKEAVNAAVYSSTFDQSPTRHVQLAELVLEVAKRRVELGKDVIIFLDSMTRLARGYNNVKGGSGRLMSGGMDSKALLKPKKFFGSARNVEDGGSLTILATALVDTESQMDVVIFEEFKGTGNLEIHLDRELAEKRVFPAIHPSKTGTRKDDLLYHEDEWKRISLIRRQMAQLPPGEAMEVLIENVQNSKSNAELLLRGLKV